MSLKNRLSLGRVSAKAKSLAGLHDARREHLGQFFTPDEIVAWIWRALQPAFIETLARRQGRVALLDNSMGIGRMFRYADPENYTLAGIDVHADSVAALIEAARASGFTCDFHHAGMEEVRLGHYSAAIINPPFSIQLDSPHLTSYEVCSHGKFGPGSSCVSHLYAVAQALASSDIVAAVLPVGFAQALPGIESLAGRLRLVAELPAGCFKSEGTEVRVAVAIWGSYAGESFESIKLASLNDECPQLDLVCRPEGLLRGTSIRVSHSEDIEQAIKTPVTGDNTVRVCHSGRRVLLQFRCGFTEAKVRNSILGNRLAWVRCLEMGRVPHEYEFTGDGKLDLQVHLMQENPVSSFESLIAEIRGAGGNPDVDAGVIGYLKRRAKQMIRHRVPFGHTIQAPAGTGSAVIEAIARKTFVTDRSRFGAPVVRQGTIFKATREASGFYTIEVGQTKLTISPEELAARFEVAGGNIGGWLQKFPGRNAAFPAIARQFAQVARRQGIDRWLNFTDYQFADLCEFAGSPFGAIAAWSMGLGKARLAIALCMIHESKRNLIVVQAHLVDEMKTELEIIGMAKKHWQVITSPEQLGELSRINIISYERLRMPVAKGARRTYARSLRHRVSTVVADEGHLLRNQDTDQTRALWQVSGRRRYLLTGTPVCNYPRDIIPLLAWVYGDGTAAQPYGLRRAFLKPSLVRSAYDVARGLDVFRERHMVLEWSTNEFSENLTGGAKREVPKIADLAGYRDLIAPLVKRRVPQEPDVAKYVRIPVPTKEVVTAEWDAGHLAYYLDVCDSFRAWYQKAHADQKNINLIALLARIQAVEAACNTPEGGSKHVHAYHGGLTSKQRLTIEKAKQFVEEGHKVLIFVHSPKSVIRFVARLQEDGIEAVGMHGGISQKERTRTLREDFRVGSAQVLVATYGVAMTGLNIPEASRVILYARDWANKTERQAMARVLRPQQKRAVHVTYIHIPGSIDEYMAQMSDMKGDASDAGLDWATPEFNEQEFVHLDTMLGRFVRDIELLRGTNREVLKQAVA